MTQSAAVDTRFAPSPTGYLHVGGARTALYSWLLARRHQGKFLLRIEDTDLARSTEESTLKIVEDLKWLGLNWDNTELVYQSRRVGEYNATIAKLIAEGKAYKAYETSEELDTLRKEAEKQKRAFIYRRRQLTQEQERALDAEGRPHVVRFVMPVKEYRFTDQILQKEIVVAGEQVQDFVIRKADGMPTYHFAVVVDDEFMGITHVMRGQEHLLNTINHIGLQEALGYARPVYGHLPVILNADGSKMGKRDRDKKVRMAAGIWLKQKDRTIAMLADAAKLAAERLETWLKNDGLQLDAAEQAAVMPVVGLRKADLPEILVRDFRENGYLPEVMINFLALLGWNPGNDLERMSTEQIVSLFSLEQVGKSNAKFARDKLLAFNTDACAKTEMPRLLEAFNDYLSVNPDSRLHAATDAQKEAMLKVNAGFRLFREVDDKCGFLFVKDDSITYPPELIAKALMKDEGQGLRVLRELTPILAETSEWTAPLLEERVKAYCEAAKVGLGKVAQPLRLAISGSLVSPAIFPSLEMLGRERTLARIAKCVAAAS